MALSQAHFQNAQNIQVHNGQFVNIVNASGAIISNTTNYDHVSTTLFQNIAAGAIFDSAARYAAGKCHPGTRKGMIERIIRWTNDPKADQRLLWMYGAAGAGKSALAHTICELLKDSHPDIYGGSFFFTSGSTDRGNAQRLFATLSYQLAIQFPSMRAEINRVLSQDASLPTKSMEIQLRTLIVEPSVRCQASLTQSPVLIIDGLDECLDDEGMDIQSNIVALVAKAIVEYDAPLRFMIASRPEYWIRDTFDTLPVPGITHRLSLRDDLDADKDIREYLIDGFEKIRKDNKRKMGSVVPPWPTYDVINNLVDEASGQYIYASTVLKFVGKFSKFSNPQEQLRIITSPGPHHASAFSELDRLYATILSAYPRWETMKRVLAALLVGANATIINIVLGIDNDEVVLVLDALSSLIDIITPTISPNGSKLQIPELLPLLFDNLDDDIVLCHRSFGEFLKDQCRSGAFYIELHSAQVPWEIVNGYFSTIQCNLDQNYEVEPILPKINPVVYRRILLSAVSECIAYCPNDTLLELITQTTEKLRCFNTRELVHIHSLFFFLHDLRGLERCIDHQLDHPRLREDGLLKIACQTSATTIYQTRQRALSGMPLCAGFHLTPALVYMLEYCRHYTHLCEGLAFMYGVVDMIPVFREYQYVLDLSHKSRSGWDISPMSVFHEREAPGWRNKGAWAEQCTSIAYQILNATSECCSTHFFQCTTPRLCRIATTVPRSLQSALSAIYFEKSISDVCNEEYFRNTKNLEIVALMTNREAWVHRLSNDDLRISIISWINRQLTNPKNLKALQDYDKTLQQTLKTLAFELFKGSKFLKFFESSKPERPASNSRLDIEKWAQIKVKGGVLRLGPQPFQPAIFPGDSIWMTFHNRIFGTMSTNTDAPNNYLISPSLWHPHVASTFLHSLARDMQNRNCPDLPKPEFADTITHLNPWQRHYLIQCLSHAHPTPENLESLREIVSLYPLEADSIPLPHRFWSSVVEVLQKYDRSVLSSEEFELFSRCLSRFGGDQI